MCRALNLLYRPGLCESLHPPAYPGLRSIERIRKRGKPGNPLPLPKQISPATSAFLVDSSPETSNNAFMSTGTLPAGNHELNEAITRRMKGVRDPEAARKACERMDRMREEIRRRVGTVEIAIDFIRELRDQ